MTVFLNLEILGPMKATILKVAKGGKRFSTNIENVCLQSEDGFISIKSTIIVPYIFIVYI